MSVSPSRLRLAELLASLSLATDLGTGQPLGHGLRTCQLAVALAGEMGYGPERIASVHRVALLRFLGCTADAGDTARGVGGDDLSFNAAMGPVLSGSRRLVLATYLQAVGAGQTPSRRLLLRAGALIHEVGDLAAHCEVATLLAKRLGMPSEVVHALSHAYERWDGKGFPTGLEGEAVPLEIRIAMVARDADLLHVQGEDVAARLARRRGKAYDPQVVDAYGRLASAHWEADLAAVLDAEPEPVAYVDDLDGSLGVLADFVDLKSGWTRGHSPRVADLAAGAARAAGLSATERDDLRRAALVHDIGRIGVENGVWDKPGRLSTDEWEKVRLHAYLTDRVLSRCKALAPLGELASSHHERLDGSGYHRRLSAGHLAAGARILAAADVMVALTSARPHRDAMSLQAAGEILDAEVAAGRLDRDAVAWVMAAAGGDEVPKRPNPGGLTDREVEVLRLLAAGRTNRQMGEDLFISPKTVGRHVENIYARIGVSTRAGAAVYAMEHRLLG
jgi:HD-GYP domain-containing protein (c-di-GMP phosphodiesterase class II)/DNA-binding CsgD family transcriptional regulator